MPFCTQQQQAPVKTCSIPTRKTPTPDKAFCATAPPSSIAHLVGRIHRHGDVHAGQEVQERSAGAETYMQPSAVRQLHATSRCAPPSPCGAYIGAGTSTRARNVARQDRDLHAGHEWLGFKSAA
ncbi:hypothetical protein PF005_g24302 [Phytophthora fragariae]|uniref:Uncharacterized protein n=1 Tax=Phytophthora fragariae TaxID=53985 RepID=A0A6A3W8K1_9STRA|nr:hypothetical protein PF005_g24302 [Phytophthora fragariae]